tara:strand:- start:2447 stop:2662 length:216 start_codon:yes stop_codon:yes gene_type:complete
MDNSQLSQKPVQEEQKDVSQEGPRLVDLPVDNEITALNIIVSFIAQAQKRGAFTIEESSKIWECVKVFQKK